MHQKIAIYGEYKTGTTACFLMVREALPLKPREIFEEPLYQSMPDDDQHPLLAKVIIPPDPNLYQLKVPVNDPFADLKLLAKKGIQSFERFDKHLLLVRDPRDRIVSGALFLSQERKEIHTDPKALKLVLDTLKQKEENPSSISMLEILETILQKKHSWIEESFKGFIQQRQRYFIDFARQHSHFMQWKYEDMIQGKSGEVEEYLGLKLSTTFETENAYQHVKRAAGSGDWRHWFTEKDVAFFAPLMHKYLEVFGYPPEWQLSGNPVIESEHATEYIIRTVNRKNKLYEAKDG